MVVKRLTSDAPNFFAKMKIPNPVLPKTRAVAIPNAFKASRTALSARSGVSVGLVFRKCDVEGVGMCGSRMGVAKSEREKV